MNSLGLPFALSTHSRASTSTCPGVPLSSVRAGRTFPIRVMQRPMRVLASPRSTPSTLNTSAPVSTICSNSPCVLPQTSSVGGRPTPLALATSGTRHGAANSSNIAGLKMAPVTAGSTRTGTPPAPVTASVKSRATLRNFFRSSWARSGSCPRSRASNGLTCTQSPLTVGALTRCVGVRRERDG